MKATNRKTDPSVGSQPPTKQEGHRATVAAVKGRQAAHAAGPKK